MEAAIRWLYDTIGDSDEAGKALQRAVMVANAMVEAGHCEECGRCMGNAPCDQTMGCDNHQTLHEAYCRHGDPPDDTDETCRECGDEPVGLDGWDGMCGDCADAAGGHGCSCGFECDDNEEWDEHVATCNGEPGDGAAS